MASSSISGAPVVARAPLPGPEDVATGTAGVGDAEAKDTGTLAGGDEGLVEGVVVEVVGCGHNALAVPPRAASMPQIVIGIVTPVPGVPGAPIGMPVVPAPVHAPTRGRRAPPSRSRR